MSDLRVRFGSILSVALAPMLILGLFLSFKQDAFLYTPLTLLIWAIAYFSIWISIDKLIFSHLRRFKIASDRFSKGNLDARVGSIPDAPARISDLATAFDSMADNISEREEKLVDNLQEKEILLREIHHRVKNNLQIIISLLNMQERKLTDQASLNAIQETRSRINAIALVHRGLYEGNDIRVIDMPMFLSRLVEELSTGLGVDEKKVDVQLRLEDIRFDPDTAVPVALFIVEAFTNALKHGVEKGDIISIALEKKKDVVSISVSDNGRGETRTNNKGTGAKLIKGFARQLGGTISRPQQDKGYAVALTFKR